MSAFLLDSSCIVAALCGWHERHRPVLTELQRCLDDGDALLVAAHALSEALPREARWAGLARAVGDWRAGGP